MIPDPTTGHAIRMLAFAMVAACVVVDLASCSTPEPVSSKGQRIVSVGGAVTETVFALGAGSEVVAVDTSSVYPEKANQLPKVGYQRTLSAEGILALSPDLVIVSDEAGPPSTFDQLRSAGVRVERMPPAKTRDEAVARIVAIGKAIDRPAAAFAETVRREAAAAIAREPKDGPRFVLIYARGAGTMMVAGSDTSGVAMVELAGGRNAIADITGYKPLSAEVLIAAAPDVLVLPARSLPVLGGEAGVLALPGVAESPAGKARRIVAFDDLLLLGFGPRLPTAVTELAQLLRAGETTAAR